MFGFVLHCYLSKRLEAVMSMWLHWEEWMGMGFLETRKMWKNDPGRKEGVQTAKALCFGSGSLELEMGILL